MEFFVCDVQLDLGAVSSIDLFMDDGIGEEFLCVLCLNQLIQFFIYIYMYIFERDLSGF